MEHYDFRKRNQKPMYISSGSESEQESDSNYSDPDYTITKPQRKKQKNNVAMEEARVMRLGHPQIRMANGEGEAQSSQGNTQASCSRQSTSNRTSEVKRTMLSWLIDLDIIRENERVLYMNENENRVVLEGIIKRAGVLCKCCGQEITVHEFERHAGSDSKRPYDNIFLANSRYRRIDREKKPCSLLQCQIDALKLVQPRDGATDKKDDACMICADGGNLICCKRCPSTFHPNCMDMEKIPQGDWLCPLCVCKYCDGGDDELHRCIQCEKKFMEVAEEQNIKNQNELAPNENTARLALPDLNLEPVLLDLNLEPALLDLNLEPPEDNEL